MNNLSKISKLFLPLLLILAFSSMVYASEITGTLFSSSNETSNTSEGSGESEGSSGFSERENEGSVLGASTVANREDESFFSSDGMALDPSSRRRAYYLFFLSFFSQEQY